MGKAGVKFEVIQEVLSQHGNELSVSLLCEIAGVSRSGYYSWLKAEGTRVCLKNKKYIRYCFQKPRFIV